MQLQVATEKKRMMTTPPFSSSDEQNNASSSLLSEGDGAMPPAAANVGGGGGVAPPGSFPSSSSSPPPSYETSRRRQQQQQQPQRRRLPPPGRYGLLLKRKLLPPPQMMTVGDGSLWQEEEGNQALFCGVVNNNNNVDNNNDIIIDDNNNNEEEEETLPITTATTNNNNNNAPTPSPTIKISSSSSSSPTLVSADSGTEPWDAAAGVVAVRSTFAVRGICCATEVPAVRQIVRRAVPGVQSLQINIPAGRVYVRHDGNVVVVTKKEEEEEEEGKKIPAAQIIAQRLTEQGFPATVLVDGARTLLLQQSEDDDDDDDATMIENPSQSSNGGACASHVNNNNNNNTNNNNAVGCTTLKCTTPFAKPNEDTIRIKEMLRTIPGVTNVKIHHDQEHRENSLAVLEIWHDTSILEDATIMLQGQLTRVGFPTTMVWQARDDVKARKAVLKLFRKHETRKQQRQRQRQQDTDKSSASNTTTVAATTTSFEQQQQHLWVESTLLVSDAPTPRAGKRRRGGKDKAMAAAAAVMMDAAAHPHYLSRAAAERYGKTSVRAVHVHTASRTVKVEHRATQPTAQEVADWMTEEWGRDVTVLVDGQAEQLTFPGMDDDDDDEEQGHAAKGDSGLQEDWHRTQLHLNVILSGIFWFVSMLSFVGYSEDGEANDWAYLRYAGLLSVLFGLPPVAIKAWRTILRCSFDSNCMMVTAALGALALGEFDEAASVSFLFAVSEFLEARATDKARNALEAIVHLRPDNAHILHPQTGKMFIVPASQVPLGCLVALRTGDKLGSDGVVVEGTSQVDASSLTGESVPLVKTVGDPVAGGSINMGTTQLLVRTTTTAEDSAVSRLVRLVEEAQAHRSPTEKMIDSFARAYTPSVLFLAFIMCTLPWLWGREEGRHWTLNGLIIIVVACPCALTISTPVTYAAGLAATAQRGIIVKGGASLETMGSVETVLLDKTGTITKGTFQITYLEVIGERFARTQMLELLALMEAPSSHPLSATMVKAAQREGVAMPTNKTVREHSILKGEGVMALVDGQRVYVGNTRLFERIGMYDDMPQAQKTLVEDWGRKGGSVGFLGVQGIGIIGSYCVTDEVRPEAHAVVSELLHAGKDVRMLTGDSEGAARAVACQIGLPYDSVHAKLLPEDKLHKVGSFKSPAPKNSFSICHKRPRVLFCGDGVNDGPALAMADVAVSMGEGTNLAMEVSDVTLMDSNLSKLVYVIKMGSRVVRTIRENIIISLACKLLVVALTFAGSMSLMFAIISDVGVMLLVTINGLKLLPKHDDVTLERRSKSSGRSGAYEQLPSTSERGLNQSDGIV